MRPAPPRQPGAAQRSGAHSAGGGGSLAQGSDGGTVNGRGEARRAGGRIGERAGVAVLPGRIVNRPGPLGLRGAAGSVVGEGKGADPVEALVSAARDQEKTRPGS